VAETSAPAPQSENTQPVDTPVGEAVATLPTVTKDPAVETVPSEAVAETGENTAPPQNAVTDKAPSEAPVSETPEAAPSDDTSASPEALAKSSAGDSQVPSAISDPGESTTQTDPSATSPAAISVTPPITLTNIPRHAPEGQADKSTPLPEVRDSVPPKAESGPRGSGPKLEVSELDDPGPPPLPPQQKPEPSG